MYERMYHILFQAITDAMEMMESKQYQGAMSRLEQATREAEEVYISE